jgi:4-aminobutyrate aminotransferase
VRNIDCGISVRRNAGFREQSSSGGARPGEELAEAVLYRALDRALSFKTTMGNVLTLTPPLTVTPAQMLDALAVIEEAIAAGM